jgi:hypothetical protein
MSVFYLKKLSGEVIPIEIGEVVAIYRIAYARLSERTGYDIKLFHDGELLPHDAKAVEGQVIDVLYVPVTFEAEIRYISQTLGIDRYLIQVYVDRAITHRLFFYENEGVLTPDFKTYFNSFAELVDHMTSDCEYTEEVRSTLVEAITREWVPKCVKFEQGN